MPLHYTLSTPIKELPFTTELKSFGQQLKLNTVEELLNIEVADLIKCPGFTYHILQEWVQFLEREKLAHLLKE